MGGMPGLSIALVAALTAVAAEGGPPPEHRGGGWPFLLYLPLTSLHIPRSTPGPRATNDVRVRTYPQTP